VSPVRYELGLYIIEDGILQSHRRQNLKSYEDALLISQEPANGPYTGPD
jgi:hypothetical protein